MEETAPLLTPAPRANRRVVVTTLAGMAVLCTFLIMGVQRDTTFVQRDTSAKGEIKCEAIMYQFSGCYYDDAYNRILPSETEERPNDMTPELCAELVAKEVGVDAIKTYTLGVEFGQQCFYYPFVSDEIVVKDKADCNMKCPGDKTRMCGGFDRINIFSASCKVVETHPYKDATHHAATLFRQLVEGINKAAGAPTEDAVKKVFTDDAWLVQDTAPVATGTDAQGHGEHNVFLWIYAWWYTVPNLTLQNLEMMLVEHKEEFWAKWTFVGDCENGNHVEAPAAATFQVDQAARKIKKANILTDFRHIHETCGKKEYSGHDPLLKIKQARD